MIPVQISNICIYRNRLRDNKEILPICLNRLRDLATLLGPPTGRSRGFDRFERLRSRMRVRSSTRVNPHINHRFTPLRRGRLRRLIYNRSIMGLQQYATLQRTDPQDR